LAIIIWGVANLRLERKALCDLENARSISEPLLAVPPILVSRQLHSKLRRLDRAIAELERDIKALAGKIRDQRERG
jgi:hypothetical protein